MPKITIVNKANKAQGKCSKCGDELPAGSTYRWWKFMRGPRMVRCMKDACTPQERDLTRSEWVQRTADFEDQRTEIVKDLSLATTDLTDFVSAVEFLRDEIREYGEEIESRRESMPEQLQEGDTGQLLLERSEMCEQAADELDQIIDTAGGQEFIDLSDEEVVTACGIEAGITRDLFDSRNEWVEECGAEATQENENRVQAIIDDFEGVVLG